MFNIFVCEDNEKQRLRLNKLIEDIVMIENYDMKIAVSTTDPDEILNYLEQKRCKGIYFLDIEFGLNKMNGLALAQKIRKYDNLGFIIFITSHSEMSFITFTYKVEALDFIIKDSYENIRFKIADCLREINNKNFNEYDDNKTLIVKSNDRIINIKFDEIIYIETSEDVHKILLHSEDRDIEFFGNMKAILSELDERFYRCNRSYIVNKNKIKEIDVTNRYIYFNNGDKCIVSFRKIKSLMSK